MSESDLLQEKHRVVKELEQLNELVTELVQGVTLSVGNNQEIDCEIAKYKKLQATMQNSLANF